MADTSLVSQNGQKHNPYTEIGTTGLKQWDGRLAEEFLRAWRGSQKHRTIAEMQTDAIIAASLWVYELLMRQVSWSIEAAGPENAAQEAAAFARQVWFQDMSISWSEILSEILSMIAYGWSFVEMVYKRRQGDHRDPSRRSHFSDGGIGLRKLAIRGQETLDRWDIGSDGSVQAMHQWDQTLGTRATIPIEKALLFRTTVHKGSPEGTSLLRGCYMSWFHKKHLQQIQAIGIERDAAGLPVVRVPKVIMEQTEYASIYADYKKIAVNLRNDEQAGLVLPSDRDEHGQYYYDVSLLSSAGSRQIDIDKALQARSLEIMLRLLTDILVVGHEKVGSFALSSSKTSLLATGLGGFMTSIVEVINRHGMPRLWRLNGRPQETMPRMVHGDIETVDLNEVGNFILRMAQAGFQVDDLENEVRRRTGFPLLTEGQ